MRQPSIADKLKRLAGDTPQHVIVQKSGITSDQVSKIFSGDTKDPRWSTMVALLRKGLRASLDAFEEDEAESKLNPYDTNPDVRPVIDALVELNASDRRKVFEFVEWLSATLADRPKEGVRDHKQTHAAERTYDPLTRRGTRDR